MQILFLTSRLPYPPYRGDRLRTNHFLRLFAHDHDLTLLSFIADEQERHMAAHLAPYCHQMHLVHRPAWESIKDVAVNAWRDIPLQTLFYRSRKMEKKVENLLSSFSFDLVYVHLFRMAQYVAHHPEIYRVLDLTDLISYELQSSMPYRSIAWKFIYRFELPRIIRYEEEIGSRFNEVWFISRRDRALFLANGRQVNARVVPHSIGEEFSSLNQNFSGPLKLLFIGHLEVGHNIDAVRYMAEEIMPLILREAPEVEFQIIGAGDLGKVRNFARFPGVRVVGFVPDLKTVFKQNAIAVAPLRFSAGIQNKVVEAMAAGLVVVTTSNVNAGLEAAPEQDLLIADNSSDFAAQVLRLVNNDPLRQRIGQAGRAFARNLFLAEPAAQRLIDIRHQIAD
jgi:sugar transferase (PEP-CTERM/EpsH1 system associated)